MTDARQIAAASTVTENWDGSRTIYWAADGISRTYSREDIAGMFLHMVERGVMNPIFERLTTSEERRQMYRDLEEVSDAMAVLVAGSDTTTR